LQGAEITCVLVQGEPWFKAKEIAATLGYSNTKQAVQINVDDEDKKQYKHLDAQSPGLKSNPAGGTVSYAVFVNESGLYSLILRSNKAEAKVFKRWVTSEFLPQIRKTGSYKSRYDYWRNKLELGATPQQRWTEVKRLAEGREDELHYEVIKHIKKQYPEAIVNAGIGEHFTTDHARMDARLKGYVKGQPDITIIRGLPNGFQDVLAVELKNPNGKGKLSNEQVVYIDSLELKCRVPTIVSCDYADVIIQIHDHYKEVFARASSPALTDKPKTYDFSTNENPQYWCNKLRNHTEMQEQCKQRGISPDEVRIMTKREIASILITFDKEH
jgi:prophage antirepressor-like protein